jgi:hypothetical protein
VRLLNALTQALTCVLDDAIEMEVESDIGFSISDFDVPSVAPHHQNEYKTGFFPIVRVIAEIWSRLSHKESSAALVFVEIWSSSQHKLIERLALFAAADGIVSPDKAADTLLSLPQGLLFLTSSTVEVYRPLRERWTHFSSAKRDKIEETLAAGPPSDWFRADGDVHVERSRFDVLGEMERAGLTLGDQTKSLLAEIKRKNPSWQLRPPEQAGFHMWRSGVNRIVGDAGKLRNVPIQSLVEEARKLADNADFMSGDDWQALCHDEPQRALDGLNAEADKGKWPAWAWNPFLWATQKLNDPDSSGLTAELLLRFPSEDFPEVVSRTARGGAPQNDEEGCGGPRDA